MHPESKKHWKKVCFTKQDKLITEKNSFVGGSRSAKWGGGVHIRLAGLDSALVMRTKSPSSTKFTYIPSCLRCISRISGGL